METFRIIMLVLILTLSIIDLSLTYYYVNKYKEWQPNKEYKQIELNPLLVFLWTKLGLILGMIIGSIIILTLNYIIVKDAHWIFPILILGLLLFAMYNHAHNIALLNKLIEQYPTGHLPESFGVVQGNN